MRFIQVLSVLVAGAAAQTSVKSIALSPSSTACAAQNILDACLATQTALLQTCQPLDWGCQCNAQKLIVRCYDNCPGDVGVSTAQAVQTQYCNAASQQSTLSTASNTGSATSTAAMTQTASSSSTSATASGKSGAAPIMSGGNGLLVAAIGIAALI